MSSEKYKVIIIGSGPAGYTAAIYAGRATLSPLVFAGPEPGGQLTTTTDVENYPGFPDGVQGPDLMVKFKAQAERFDSVVLSEEVDSVDFSKRPFVVKAGGKDYLGDSVVIATGASAQWLGLESEQRLRGRGVSSCATCDGFFFKEKDVVLVGGGDVAMEDALFLARVAKSVTVLHRRDALRASKIMQERALANKKIFFMWNTEVVDVLGSEAVSGVLVVNNKTGEKKEISCQGLFVAIGHKPNTGVFVGQIDLDEKGYIATQQQTRTSVDGVFACGDVVDARYRQAVTAAGSGCAAAIDAERWLEEKGDAGK